MGGTAGQLEKRLEDIHRKSYPAYKSLTGSWQFPDYVLHIDHVQGDPFASPSWLRVEVPAVKAAFPADLYDTKEKKTALEDALIREFGHAVSGYMFRAKGSGKSGLLSVSRCGQEILERTSLTIDERSIQVRFEAGFPADGRRINGPELRKILFEYIPVCVRKSLYYRSLDPDRLQAAADLAEDQTFIREELKRRNLAAFVANGSVLPRESGVSDRPMKGAVAFQSPPSMEVELILPHKGPVKGMGIPRGITLIVGGGYHGKSTLLKALELGVYNHVRGDGREYVITDDTAVKIRAEDGRSVCHADISLFINHLPNGKNTEDFSTADASGSTSQAAAVVEALEAGAGLLLMDEDTSATNFMVRDALMQSVISKEKEPITPFIGQAARLYEEKGISVILVAGSSGAYFYIADHIIQMDTYRAFDITDRVKEICRRSGNTSLSMDCTPAAAGPKSGSLSLPPRYVKAAPTEKKHGQIKIRQYGKDSFSIGKQTVELKYVEQIADSEQTMTLACVLRQILLQMETEKNASLEELAEKIWKQIEARGLSCLAQGAYIPAPLAMIRKQEIYACLNRYRGFY